MLKIILVAGARPNFMKIAPLVAAMKRPTATQFRASETLATRAA